jgi:hypothetical protein
MRMRITPTVSLPEIPEVNMNTPLIIRPSVETDPRRPVKSPLKKELTTAWYENSPRAHTPISIAIPFSTRQAIQVIETNSHTSQIEKRHVSTSRNGFLWKPVSEHDGKLVVLLPQSITGKVKSASLHASLPPRTETLIEDGRFTGDTHNGGRSHYRFSKAGKEYPNKVFVVVELKEGSYTSFEVRGSANRNN